MEMLTAITIPFHHTHPAAATLRAATDDLVCQFSYMGRTTLDLIPSGVAITVGTTGREGVHVMRMAATFTREIPGATWHTLAEHEGAVYTAE